MNKADWLQEARAWFAQCESESACAVVLPAYRPDVVAALAAGLGLTYLDFRREKLAPLGWKAAGVPLQALDAAALAAMALGSGVVLQNTEALLSLHDTAARRLWFNQVFSRRLPQPLLLPIVLFDSELPTLPDRIHRVDPGSLPEESLLLRLASV